MLMQQVLKKTVLALLLSAVAMMQVQTAAAADPSDDQQSKEYAKFNKAAELVRPTDYREWIFVGAPVTPKDMNDGKPAFPEFHNVYIDPASWAHYKKTGEFRSGTIIVKELISVGATKSASGNGYFQGEFLGIAAAVKDKKRFADRPENWAYFGFDDKPSAMAQPDDACSACHKANAAEDMVFTQHYPVLRAAKAAVKPR
ncbi:Cytochrome P460 [Nitrosospira sp. Nsp14]|uniref:cytochrome P460 family protein n=1 Tax=Nitrosospira sp. Nsp14 TaxID=1855333 RepID=UPI0008F35E5F|nr:cytochrome P460 family protein [Nitrosospira sp. Nsp14]SFH61557.1 Cytochrome P460 [Nitrosospira sp. Nsp14]